MMASLKLNKRLPIGVGAEQASEIQQQWDTADESEGEVIGFGLVDHPIPPFKCPELDVDTLTTLDSRMYTEAYVQLLAWFAYASELLAKVQARVLQYDQMQDILTAQTRTRQREISRATPGRVTAEELRDQLLTNPEYQDITLQLQRFKQRKMLLDAKVENIERSLRVISRQVEIRKLDIEQTKTAHNMPGRNLRDPQTGAPAGVPTLGGRRF